MTVAKVLLYSYAALAAPMAVYGFYEGVTTCAWSKDPLVTQRLACGALTGWIMGGSAPLLPFACLAQLEALARGKDVDCFEFWKTMGPSFTLSEHKQFDKDEVAKK